MQFVKPIGIAVKITYYHQSHNPEVVYYRYNLPMRIIEKWKWYFEYITALIKVNNPKNKVELTIVAQDGCLCGEDYKQWKIQNLIKAKSTKIKKLQTANSDDLFNFQSIERKETINRLQKEIEDLQNGILSYIPPIYINNIKSLI